MVELTAALRFVHFAAAIALAGEFAFLLWVARPIRAEAPAAWRELRERRLRVAARWLALLLASGLAWFLVQAAVMSGAPLFDGGMLAAALGATLFGHIAIARLLLAAALAAALALLRRGRLEAVWLGTSGALAAGLLSSLAATGHGAAEQGDDRVVHLSADAVHLLAAGAWLGALPALAFALRKGADIGLAARVTRRFSALGIASVAALVLTGAVNAWYTVGDVPALFGTGYGRLLCAKLALFAAMVALAAVNRLRWTPRLSPGAEAPAVALARLRRNALGETAIGIAVLGIVGALGVTVPALHATITWPFSHTLEWSALARPREFVPAVLLLVVLGGAIAVFGAWRRRHGLAAGGAAVCALALLGLAGLFIVPAHPTTYLESPVPYSANSVLRGAPLYAEHCASCHGPYGNRDGPLADSLPRRPPNLPTRLSVRREGDLLWSIRHGVPGTMPAFGARMDDEQLWDLLNFLRAQANVDAGRRMDASVERWRAVTAPDFTFQIGRGAQESLVQQRGRNIVLLVFYSLPQSLPRLRELAAAKLSRLDRMGVRVIAVPMGSALPREAQGIDASMIAGPDPALVAAYAMFTRTIVGPPAVPPRHIEFLIDRQGYMRARSVEPGREQGWTTMAELLRQTVLLNKEKSRVAAPRRHAH